MDLYAGALTLSVALLILASFSLSPDSILKPEADKTVYRGEVAGAILLLVGSITGVWVTRRRRFLCLNDSDTAKRRQIRKFLRAISSSSSSSSLTDQQHVPASPSMPPMVPEISNLTAQTGVYPVYRRKGDKAFWSRIPSLLLVKGDWLALQIGDVGPANCVLKRDGAAPMHVAVGERLTVEHFAPTTEQLTANLPRGRNSLSMEYSDDHFLTLCNKMQIFTVVESPIDEFLRRRTVIGKSSQISRRVQAIREALFVLSFIFLVLTATIAFSRLASASSDHTLVVHMPILAALGVLPVVAPAFLFFLEVVGTSRILTTVHTYSNASSNAVNNNETNPSSPPESRLLLRYILATSLTRLSLWSVYECFCRFVEKVGLGMSTNKARRRRPSKLVRVPPASVNLLEKMGVATAFALVDDELACEPQSIPQQLLIPSGKGLKLLDLCPAYESDSDDEGDIGSVSARRHRGRSFDDSDSESEDGKQNVGAALRRTVLLKRRMRRSRPQLLRSVKSEDDETDGAQEAFRFDVQFEEPNWWQYLPSLKCIGLACLMHEEQKKTQIVEDEVSASVDDDHQRALQSPLEEFNRGAACSALVKLVCHERRSRQLMSLAECIGFSTEENAFGKRGDITPFTERLRLHVLSNQLYRNRLALDTHERSSEQSRWWGLIRPDSTSVIVEDSRTKAYQLLTVGDPAIVTTLCNEAWQGEISTILPLAAIDRKTIIDTTNNWKLADLDVAAFSYTPVPHTLETQLSAESGSHVGSFPRSSTAF